MNKIVVIWDQLGQQPIKFFVTEEQQFLTLHDVYINDSSAHPVKERLLRTLMYDTNGNCLQLLLDVFPVETVQAGTKVVVCGFLP